ncbi:MAG: hypothetical protein U1C58_06020 [Flavobacteriaceae bacterium]|nr:hypothetical protein [Flavobacteriaceae bacterium]MDZ4147821.1 hypothetical protein [Flavobacteriaceae bacterium]
MDYLIANEMKVKKVIIFSLLFMLGLVQISISQEKENNDYYTLYKGGKQLIKKSVYVLFNEFDTLKKRGDSLIFEKSNNTFIYSPQKHHSVELNFSSMNNKVFISIPQLYEMEENELKKRLDEVESEMGFRPIPPVNHKVLKVYMVQILNDKICRYEVDWITIAF